MNFGEPQLNCLRKIRPKAVRHAVAAVVRDNCRPEVGGDVIPGVAVDRVGVDAV